MILLKKTLKGFNYLVSIFVQVINDVAIQLNVLMLGILNSPDF